MGAIGGVLALSQVCGCGTSLDGAVTPANGEAVLTFVQFPKLATIGGGVVVDAGGKIIVVVRTADTMATALSGECTHEGCALQYKGGSVPLDCPCHGSTFTLDGAVVAGPARTALARYSATVNADGVTVTV